MSRAPHAPLYSPVSYAVLTVVTVTCLLTPPAQAIEAALTWARTVGDQGFCQAEAVAVDPAGNVYLTGIFAGTVDFDPGPTIFTLTAQGDGDIFVCKLHADGKFAWARAFFGGGTNEGLGIAVDADGNVYTTGRFFGSADFDPSTTVFSLTAPGGQGIFTSKLDTDGNFVWANAIGSENSQNDTGYGIAVDDEGNVYTTGSFSGTVDFDTGIVGFPISAQGATDVFIRKLDAEGNFIWARAYRGFSVNAGRGIAVDRAGNVYTTGQFRGTVDFDPGPVGHPITAAADDTAGAGDAFVAKLDTDGEFVWAGAMGGSLANTQGQGIAVDAMENVFFTGEFIGSVDFDPGQGEAILASGFMEDAFVAKLTEAGALEWVHGFGNEGVQRGTAIATGPMGEVYATGGFHGAVDFDPGPDALELTAPNGVQSAFVLRLDAAGALDWAHANGGVGGSAALGMALDGAGQVITAGAFTDTVDFSPGPDPFELTAALGSLASYALKLGQGERVLEGLAGTVTREHNGIPLACAVVELTGPGGERHAAVTGLAGAYFFEPLPPGAYSVRVLAPGYETRSPDPVTLVHGESISRDFTLQPAPNGPVVAGQVTDADTGDRLPAARVQLLIGGDSAGDTYTCGDGRYELAWPGESRKQTVQVVLALDNYEPESITAEVDPVSGAVVNGEMQKSAAGQASLAGSVSMTNEGMTLPAEGARITLRGPINATATTGTGGDYAFDSLLEGIYTVAASARGGEGERVYRTLVTDAPAEASFTLEPSDIEIPDLPGDINRDGVVNAVDVQLVINAALGIDIGESLDADINGDGVVNAVDVQLVINAALGLDIG